MFVSSRMLPSWVLWCLLEEIFKMFVFHWDSLVPDEDWAYATTCSCGLSACIFMYVMLLKALCCCWIWVEQATGLRSRWVGGTGRPVILQQGGKSCVS